MVTLRALAVLVLVLVLLQLIDIRLWPYASVVTRLKQTLAFLERAGSHNVGNAED
jgi:hypothetical protein